MLTFDIEDWFHILDNPATRVEADWDRYEPRIARNVERILECLARHRQRATFFCLGWVARRHPSVVRAICDAGHRIGTHSDMHQLAYEQEPTDFENDLRRSIDTLQQAAGQRVRHYRAPGFSITASNLWAFEKLVEAGIEVDCSVFPATRAHGGLPGFEATGPAILETASGPLKLFPLNIRRLFRRAIVFSGGGYFRLLPSALIETLFARSDYVMTYFHPRDFDPDQPILAGLSHGRRFRTYVGLGGAMAKLDRLIERFDFVDLEAAEAAVEWRTVKRLRLDVTRGILPAKEHACT